MSVVIRVNCPVCGYSHPFTYWLKMLTFGPQAFGKIERSLGRARGFEKVGDLHIEDAPEIFELIKERMLGVMSFWFKKGLVSKDDLELAFNCIKELAKRSISYDFWNVIYSFDKEITQTGQNYWGMVSRSVAK
jgi:hypothetical protein